MKNNKKIFISASLLVLLATGFIAGQNNNALLGSALEDTSIWNHYTAVDATLDSNGVREYWVNCTTHEHVFEKPAVEDSRIVDKGAPSASFISSLAANDDRLIERYTKAITFEDGLNKYISIYDGFTAMSVVDEEGVDGSKALKLSRVDDSGRDCHVTIAKEYLDAVFANTKVKSLEFYAKATVATNNFRHQKVDQAVTGNNEIISTFECNRTGYGITESYKKFLLEREIYENMNFSSWTIQYGTTSTGTFDLYLDNFRISTEEYDGVCSTLGFEHGYYVDSQKGMTYPSFYYSDWKGQWYSFKASGDPLVSIGYDYENKSEGTRSIKIVKNNGYLALYLRPQFVTNMPDEGMLFDIMGTVAVNGEVNYIDNNNTKLTSNHTTRAGLWHTLHLTKSQIGSDGRFLIIQGSTAGTFYFDNFRYVTNAEGFEDVNTAVIGDYGYATHTPINDTTANDVRDRAKNYIFLAEWKRCSSVSVVEGHCTEGAYSLKVTFSSNIGPIAISPKLQALMDDDSTVSIDFYSDDITNADQSTLFAKIVPGQWTTITLTKADFANTSGRISSSNAGAKPCTIYIDNIVFNF